MRLHEVYLLEYKREVTLSKWADKILAAAKINHELINDTWLDTRVEDYGEYFSRTDYLTDWSEDAQKDFLNDFLEKLEFIDPTANKQYMIALLRWYVGNVDKNTQLQSEWQGYLNDVDFDNDYPQDWFDLEDSDAVEDFDGDFDNFRVDAENLNTFKLEDGQQIYDTLATFERIKPQIPPQQRDIGFYSSYYQFEDYVDEVAGGGEQTEISDEVLKRNDVKVLYNGPLGTVSIPNTHEASCKLGSGTKWCTAEKNNDDWFHSYSKKNDLIIYNEKPGNAKYQFHVGIYSTEARDARDRSIPYAQLYKFENEHPVLSKILKDSRLKAIGKLANMSFAKAPDGSMGITSGADDKVFNSMLDWNEKRGGGIMKFVDGFYTSKQSTFGLANAKQLPIQKDAKRLVRYALQRKKPWPQMEQLIIALLQKTLPKVDYSNNTHLKRLENFTKIMDSYADVLNPQWKEYNDIKAEMVAGAGVNK